MNKKFPKARRLLKRRQFKQASCRALRLQGDCLYLDIAPNQLLYTRLGITVTRKYGNAPSRNRFKRIVREAFRSCYSLIPQGKDIIIRPRREVSEIKSSQLEAELLRLLS